MHPDLEKLLSLQDVDREIARLTEEVAALPKRVAEIETKLAGAKAAVEHTKNAIKGNETARRNLESDIKSHQEKISKYKAQSLDVKTNEQYKALMHEISFAEQDIRTAEDRILELMEGTEAQEKAVKAAEAALKAQSADVEREKAEAKALTSKDEQALAEWNAKRKDLRSAVSESMLAHYDRVIRTRRPAIAEARDQKCSACNVMLRPQKYNEMKMGGDVHTCDACSRILYYDPAHEPPPPAEKKKKRASSDTSVEKDWFYNPSWEGAARFFVCVNKVGGCSLRVFDAETGTKVDEKHPEHPKSKKLDYKQEFAAILKDAMSVHVNEDPNLQDDCADSLPPDLLIELRRQVPGLSPAQISQREVETATH